MAELAPERILAGRYRLLEMIGSGGMGAMWRAHDDVLGRYVAVKEIIFPPEMGPGERETARRRAVREAQLAARLLHRNIVTVYDIVEDAGRPAIVMELLPYRSLREVIRDDGPLSPVEAARVGLGVLTALQAAHGAGVLHRDVKPANIVLGPADRVILTDFGIAKAVDSPELTASGMLVGSPSYIAPERARGGNADEAADLWAVGASLYTAVEGRPPFDRGGALASLTAVVSDEPDPPVHAGPLRPVIEGLLRKDPDTRLGIAEAARMMYRIVDDRSATMVMPAPSVPDVPAPDAPVFDAPVFDDLATDGLVTGAGRAGNRGDHRALLAAVALIVAAAAGVTGFAVIAGRSSPGHAARPGAAPRPSVVHSGTAASGRGTTTGRSTAPGTSTVPSTGAGATSGNTASGGEGQNAPPAGYYTFANSTGFSIAAPSGWQISHVGHYVYIRDPANGGIFLLIDQSDQPKADPLADWRQQAASRQSTYPGYHLIALRSVPYPQAEKAADWEFSYVRDGVAVQVLNRNILANAHHAYALYWTTPVNDWDAYYHYFQAFAATFRPARLPRSKSFAGRREAVPTAARAERYSCCCICRSGNGGMVSGNAARRSSRNGLSSPAVRLSRRRPQLRQRWISTQWPFPRTVTAIGSMPAEHSALRSPGVLRSRCLDHRQRGQWLR